jgi:polysaccharide pyruvyl transferase WcaK-like protein
MKNIAFLNDTSDWYHWGCTGTSAAIKEALAARGYNITPVPIKSIYEIKSVPETIADFDNREFFNRFFHENLPVTAPILQNDIVLINGEGTLHGISRVSTVLLYLAYASKQICGKRVQIINHSCYPDDSKQHTQSTASGLYQGVYKLLDFVAVREHYSQGLLKELGIEATLSFDCLPLYIRNHLLTASAERKRTIVVAGSVAWKAKGLEALVAYMRAMLADGYDIKLLTGAKANPALDDKMFLQALKQALPEGWTHVDAPTMDAWLHTIQSASLVVSGRFHYTIAACMLGTPCIVLDSNTPKNRAICEEAGLPEPLPYDIDGLEAALHARTRSALGTSPITSAVREEWLARAQKNFAGLL